MIQTWKKRLFLFGMLLIAAFCITPAAVYAKSPTLAVDNNTAGMSKKEAQVYKKMKSMKKKLPEGTTWTNANFAPFHGGIYYGGYGCAGFAFKLSDKAFGNSPARVHKKFNKIKVGDIVRMDNDCHSVIVLKKVGKKFVVAEGNYNCSVHWGRVITLAEIKKTGTYVMTRW